MNKTPLTGEYKWHLNCSASILINLEKLCHTFLSFTLDIVRHTFYKFY